MDALVKKTGSGLVLAFAQKKKKSLKDDVVFRINFQKPKQFFYWNQISKLLEEEGVNTSVKTINKL